MGASTPRLGSLLIGLEGLALGEGDAERSIARVLGRAGRHQVPHARKPHAGHRVAAPSMYEAADLGEAAGHDQGERVVA